MKRIFALLFSCALFLSGCGSNDRLLNLSWRLYDDAYLAKLREEYPLEELVKDCPSGLEQVEEITKWVSGLWEHDGTNVPKQSDPLYILNQVTKNGQKFRCVEYGVVIYGCLNALGFSARIIGMKTEDVETREFGAGHVGAEVYLPDLKKWVFLDGQFGAIPLLEGTPLNAYEFGEALQNKNAGLEIIRAFEPSRPPIDMQEYFDFMDEYLYYLDTTYRDLETGEIQTIMYVPKGGKVPAVFQRDYPLSMDEYTSSVSRFYSKPE